ncbi:hypothetical protein A7K93_03520 [Candidatus Methylacidiphilum fumarolicum]|uniref:Uncharacterized protein n=2 Tax=Candidatus Methylacidiphilum fumarolicum TaxID=591154 RepID=I0K1G1_METFB|nr:hypothetical protein [Candidatus Methylacidiphilum fumarolicum]MBW6414914.1 hypothetical protein [Candidatus Methylacidiphilum fumarolicum]TFE70391.1 hypothetical protein A7K73_04290 [Candidatus Methylacidiphilum fumarolicum]TFE73927.1 hypothetical protein A7K72_04860 [Candidatus Methylacidiphilum fumarolicum]TFE74434.1 hypothetical protein A7K93_03520 [Candidatus Methylacidiphilum fumarolicum]TFE77904.1 hypothetical protein A7D33_02860 [Candidatus Methylacidiphilum fumarolicum]
MSAEAVLGLLMASLSFVLTAGLYAFFYAFGRLKESFFWELFSFIFAFLMICSGFFLVVSPAFTLFWKLLLIFSIFSYLIIPKAMLWVVKKIHQKEGEEEGRLKTLK